VRVGAVIIGRLDSARLPGKLLRQIGGRALLDYVAERVGRMLDAARAHRLDAAARVNGDSPWLDPDLLSTAIARMRDEQPDFVTNLAPRSWPYGVAAEVARTSALARAHAGADADDREHVTRALYRDPDAFTTASLHAPSDAGSDVRLVVDTEQDLRRFEALIERVGPDAPTALVVQAARELNH
jgi:spore coat polysaccharide biosynthesis protein SpsF